jgi:DNA-binding CsgD family transcriptional regulator
VVALAVAAVVTALVDTNRYAVAYHLGVPVGLLLAGTRSAALVAALYRPILAWWASTAAMVVVGWSADVQRNTGALPWDSGFVVQTGVLFLVALQVRPRVAVEVLVITLLAGQAFPLGDPGTNVRVTGAVLTIAVIVGASLRGRRVARSQLVVQEELTAEERARRTLLEERNRIARELHDVVAHHMSAAELAQAVRVVADGDALLAPNVTKRLIAEFSRMAGAPRVPLKDRVGDLTERETEVLSLIAQGLSNAEIAESLVVAEQTVKSHVSRILVKLGLRDRTQAAVYAYETGLVRPPGRTE